MSGIKTKAIIITYGDKPILITKVKEITTADFISIEKQANSNLEALIIQFNQLKDRIDALEKENESLKNDIAYLKGEE